MNFRKLLCLSLAISIFTFSAQAQQRKCDMAITLLSPAESAVIGPLMQFNVTVNIMNNGPDDLLAGDTVYYNTPSMFAFDYDPYILQQAIPFGNNATVTLTVNQNINENNQDEVMSYCVKVMSNLNHNGVFIDTVNGATNNMDCNTVTFKASNPNAIDELNSKQVLQLYPNPAADKINIALNKEIGDEAFVVVRDISGRSLLKQDFGRIISGTTSLQLNIAGLLPGIYLVELQSTQGKAIGKLIKH